MFGKLTDDQAKDVLSTNILGRIGCHDKGITYVVPISYVYVDDTIYCHTREGMKMEIMRRNPSVCFEVDEMSNMANWRSVIAWGKFEELKEGKERADALQHLLKRVLPIVSSETTHLSNSWPFVPTNLNEIKGIVFAINVEKITGRFEKYESQELGIYSR